jgi:ankyrin repeat protein
LLYSALIEAIKSETENLDVVEYLIREGAMVAYKTRRHGRTAIDWAKRYGVSEAAAIQERNQMILKRQKERNETLENLNLFIYDDDHPAHDPNTDQASFTADGESNGDDVGSKSQRKDQKKKKKEEEKEERYIELTEETKRLLGRPRTVRILELAAMVQKQINMLFFKIAQGNMEWVTKIIEDGDFFHPNNEINAYRDMEKFVIQAEESDKAIIDIQQRMAGMSKKVDAALIQHRQVVIDIQQAEQELQAMYQEERDLDAGINKAFVDYELLASKLLPVDLEEIVNFRHPSSLLIVSVFACGVIFDMLPTDAFVSTTTRLTARNIDGDGNGQLMITNGSTPDPIGFMTRASSLISAITNNSSSVEQLPAEPLLLSKDNIINSKSQWWPIVIKQFRKSQDLVRKFQTFSRAKLHIHRSAELLKKVKDLLHIMITIHQDPTVTAAVAAVAEAYNSLTEKSGDSEKEGDEGKDKKSGKKKRKKKKSSSSRKSSIASKSKDDDELIAGEQAFEEKSVSSRGNTKTTKPFQDDLPTEIVNPDGTVIIVEDALAKEREALESRKKGKRRPGSRSSSRQVSEDEQLDEISDAEWDSDADDAMSGEWIKGEWVPFSRKRDDWWDRSTKSRAGPRNSLKNRGSKYNGAPPDDTNDERFNTNQKTVYLTDDLIQEEKMKTVKTLNIDMNSSLGDGIPIIEGEGNASLFGETKGSDNVLNRSIVSGANSENNSRAGSRAVSPAAGSTRRQSTTNAGNYSSRSPSPSGKRRNKSISPSSPSKKSSKRKGKRQSFAASLDSFMGDDDNDTFALLEYNPLSVYHPDEEVGYRFMEILLSLLKAICRFASHFPQVLTKKEGSLAASRRLDELKGRGARLQEIYQEQYEARSTSEKDYIKLLKKSRFLHEKVEIFKNKVRVARLMNHLSVSGHTALSWASSYGLYDMVELMLSKGGSVGYVAPIFHLVATFLQRSYRIYRTLLAARYDEIREILPGSKYSANEKAKTDVIVVKYSPKKMGKADNVNLIRTLNMMKIEREKILINIKHLRSRSRFPVPEAAYTAKWEIVERIYDRRLIHNYFLNTWIYPAGPPPLSRQVTRAYDHSKIELTQVVANGMNDLAAGTYLPESGWVGANDPQDPYGETQVKIFEILAALKEKQDKFRGNRERIRILNNEAMNQRLGEQEMIKAIYVRDFQKCLQLAQDRGITIDLETPDGQTALIGASEEDCDAMNHTFMKNDDGRDCLQVEFLLDRRYYRPSLNLETTKGYTALIRACMLGRANIVVALLDRGADLNYQNKFKRTALHYCASLGHGKVLRILLERLADLDLKDIHGNTAYDLAEKENFVNAMTLLSQFRSGNIGGLQLTRGRVNNYVLCSLGCGKRMFPHENVVHIQEECILREVSCTNGCGEHGIMFRELSDHVENQCSVRRVVCSACGMKGIVIKQLKDHMEETCEMRLLPCFLGCEKIYPFKEMEKHMELRCIHRLVPCSLQCFVQSDLCLPTSGGKAEGQKKKKKKKTLKAKGTGTVSEESMQAILAKIAEDDEADALDENAPVIRKVRYCDMKDHTANECVNRRVVCPNRCHNVIVQHQLAAHMRDICPDRLVACQFCHEQIKKKDHQQHEEVECLKRLVPCREKCGEIVVFEEMDAHIRDVCAHRTLPCIFNCHQIIQRKYYQRHIEEECRNRLVACPYKCCADPVENADCDEESIDSQVQSYEGRLRASSLSSVESTVADELQSFVSSIASTEQKRDRLKKKKSSIAVKMIPAYMLDQHMKYECEFRPVRCQQCNAAVTVPSCELKHHQTEECTHRIVGCRNEGCLKHLPWHERDHHETVKCRFRMIACPQACGELIPFLQASVHVHRFCRLRIADCVLGCGMKVKWPDMEVHTTMECVRRHVPQAETKKKRKAGAPPPPPDSEKKKTLGEIFKENQEAEREAVKKMKNKLAQSEAVKSRISSIFGPDGSRPSSNQGQGTTRSGSRGKSRESSSRQVGNSSSTPAMPPIK